MLPFEILHCFCSFTGFEKGHSCRFKNVDFLGEKGSLWNVAVGSEQGGGMPPLSPPTLPPGLEALLRQVL